MAQCQQILERQTVLKDKIIEAADGMNSIKKGRGDEPIKIVTTTQPNFPLALLFTNLEYGNIGFKLSARNSNYLERARQTLKGYEAEWNNNVREWNACESSGGGGGGNGGDDGNGGVNPYNPDAFKSDASTLYIVLGVVAVVVGAVFYKLKKG